MKHRIWIGLAVSLLPLYAAAQDIDDHALNGTQDGRNWAAFGRTFDESHYSPLSQINTGTVRRLGLAWSLDLDTTNSVTAPLEVDGVLYLSSGYGIVQAVDVRTGRNLWRYDAKPMDQPGASKMRIDWGIRGLAFWKGRVYTGTADGRLLAINARDGAIAWSVQTVDPGNGAAITGAPRVFNGKVIIGFGGGDFSPLRGYVSTYDASTGKLLWRFYTVPPRPGAKDGAASDDILAKARGSWTGTWWKYGGGGTVWNAITYDPDFNRIYIGTGNGDPMNWKLRSPGGGDNLFIASIVALDADTGRYVWHYQTTPGDSWDYDATTDMTLTTLRIDGQDHKVLIQAAKNGFIYVIDRANGKLLSADKLGTVTWAERVDPATGRPVLVPGARYEHKSILLWPSFQSVHHWPPQSLSPRTGYMYEPTLEMPATYGDEGVDLKHFHPRMWTNDYTGLTVGNGDVPVNAGHSVLKAWDLQHHRIAWQVETAGISNGGTLATGGDLVFQGLADGYLHAYAARDGRDLWSYFAKVAVTGVPITYSVDGKQYLTITAGPLAGSTAGFGSISGQWGWDPRIHPRRLLTFVLDGKAQIPPTPPRRPAVPLDPPGFQVDAARAKRGAYEYIHCVLCHGMGVVAGGIAPDLRASPVPLSMAAFVHVVRDGGLKARGMPQFAEITDEQLEDIQQFIRQKARADLKAMQQPTAQPLADH